MLGIEGRREGKWEKGRGRRMEDPDRSWEWWRLSLWILTNCQLNSSEWYVAQGRYIGRYMGRSQPKISSHYCKEKKR